MDILSILLCLSDDHMLDILQINNPLYKILQPLQEQNAEDAYIGAKVYIVQNIILMRNDEDINLIRGHP